MNGGSSIPFYPFDPQRNIGTVSQVGPSSAKVNLPQAGQPSGRLHHGHRIGGGEVGEFVVVECDEVAVFGRIIEVRLPERERLGVESELGKERDVHPLGTIQLLASINLASGDVLPGVSRHPRLGNQVYAAHPDLARWLIERSWRIKHGEARVTLNMATLPGMEGVTVGMTAEQLFGRHCAVLGATGGGKSWTVARLIEEAIKFRSKIILLDATGEFHNLTADEVQHVSLGDQGNGAAITNTVSFPYTELTASDLFALFTPSGQSQAPKLREAIKSLKIAQLEPSLAPQGYIVKAQQRKQPFDDAYREHVAVVESSDAHFAIEHLARQVGEECVWPTGGTGQAPDPSSWGRQSNEAAYCVPLQMRIENIIQSKDLACVFSPSDDLTLPDAITNFLADRTCRVLRVSMEHVPFANNARPIVANAIGRCLLGMASDGLFRNNPVVVFLDEAHQFLNKSLGDEAYRVSLDAFGLIAKEGRKYSLNICIATQRPRDIPEDVLSQIGTLIVHRLTNEQDRRVVESASGEIDRSASAFLPTLGPGEALIVGVDFPVPLTVQIEPPQHEPQSKGADYQGYWCRGSGDQEASGDEQDASSEEGDICEDSVASLDGNGGQGAVPRP